MTIRLISDQQYNELLEIQKKHPILTYQNKGYDTFDKSKMTEEDREAFKKVSEVLSKHIDRFEKFQNFKIRKNGEIVLRFQYGWDERFTGVGYLELKELHKGFNNQQETEVN